MDEHERTQHIEHILQLSQRMMDQRHTLDSRRDRDMLLFSLPITMQQFKNLMLVTDSQGMTVGRLAKALGVGLPTVSGIVDRLYEHGMVTRGEDPEDRRVTRITATARGREIVQTMYNRGRNQFLQLMERLTDEELRIVENAFEILSKATPSDE